MAEVSGNRRLGPGATEHRCSLSMASVRALLSGPKSSLGQAVDLSSGGWPAASRNVWTMLQHLH
eukprot:scaffold41984_cov70-Phaeocystis_antarctica.AAC.1